MKKKDSEEPTKKKAKLSNPASKLKAKQDGEKATEDDDEEETVFCQQLWEHFGNYIESLGGAAEQPDGDDGDNGGGGGGGDTDELEEIVSLIQQSKLISSKLPKFDDENKECVSIKSIRSCVDMIPILYSVSSHLLAEAAVGQSLAVMASSSSEKADEEAQDNHQTIIRQFLNDSIRCFPLNAATWSMAANYGRSMIEAPLSPEMVTHWYNHAVQCAQTVRREALELLERIEQEDNDDDDDNDTLKEWIETLLLNHVVGVEWMAAQDEDDEDEDVDLEDAEKEKAAEDTDGYWTSSSVEATARFMAAMQLSILGKHVDALVHLKEFPLTHRLAPNLWKATSVNHGAAGEATSNDGRVVLYRRGVDEIVDNGVLPFLLYQRLCMLFGPKASYWTESNYATRGYYSFFMDQSNPPQEDSKTNATAAGRHSNLIYEVIEDHLLPLVQKELEKNKQTEEIVGYEWWVHHRPVGQNLGHNLHFDTDEGLLKAQGEVTHPVYSSVLYLTGEGDGGATIVLDQTPDSTAVAQRAWKNVPINNSFLVFPGNLLHGVFPCCSTSQQQSGEDKTQSRHGKTAPKVDELFQLSHLTKSTGEKSDNGSNKNNKNINNNMDHRLSFMVGFWARRVPDQMKEQKMYGPCGPLPPATLEHSWVQELCKGYNAQDKTNQAASNDTNQPQSTRVTRQAVPPLSPVWEEISSNVQSDDPGGKTLEIPRAIDHRFFVNGAPECFRASLFEDDDDDDCE